MMERLTTTDNNLGKFTVEKANDIENLSKIANKTLKALAKENPNLLIFPTQLGEYDDDIAKSTLFSLYNNGILTTENCMGFVSCNDTQLTISSRFYSNGNDYFLHYMLQKVFAFNILNMDFNTSKDNVSDIFLLYLLPFYLKKALQQGLFKEYQRQQHNDTNVKGTINISKHLKQNIPFMGKIAYTTREHSYDNRITQLIRHTIEYIKTHDVGNGIFKNDYGNTSAAQQIFYATPSYQRNARTSVTQQNQKAVHHPYFTEYEILRKICLQILNKEGISYGKEKDKVYGLVFDGAWLWEEYLNTILKDKGFIHPQNKTQQGGISIYQEDNYKKWFPDFYSKDKKKVLDAKYKRMDENGIDNKDLHQIVAYMYILQATEGSFIYPLMKEETITEFEKTLIGYGGKIKTHGVEIPQNITHFQDFIKEMHESEKNIARFITKPIHSDCFTK